MFDQNILQIVKVKFLPLAYPNMIPFLR